ncbi:DUF421 domain-containing protein [Tahibacter amnicola]|uniref:DUF421 domain-containing protein n=1 Tax=Tahibacter amnicola TaxID=2976241 RepID=A0ABY6BJC1_9GAMM|nr:YetF domain-containing protein [Tahibacter amnicola]UXI69864.1 DUF421 domain-containing protein [Tahibacter amnicola]
MFDLSLPWWHFVVRGAVVYLVLMVLVRIAGKRTVGEFTPFDLLVVILIGETTQGALTGGDNSVLGAIIVAATLVALNYGVGFASTRSRLIDTLTEGEPVIVVRDGRILHKAMRRNNLPESDLEEALRKADVTDPADVQLAVLETNGEITVVTRK